MGVFDRIKRIVKSNVNAILDRAEDPEKVLEQAVVDMKAEHVKARESLMDAMVNEKKKVKGLDTERAQAQAWRDKAGKLLGAGNETAAKEALVRHKASVEMVAAKEKELENHRSLIMQLKHLVDEMGKKIELAKVKKIELTTRMKSAQAADATSSTPSMPSNEAFKEFERFVDKVEEQETRAEIMKELSGEKIDEELLKIDDKLALPNPVDDELERLKKELGLDKKALPEA